MNAFKLRRFHVLVCFTQELDAPDVVPAVDLDLEAGDRCHEAFHAFSDMVIGVA